MREQPRQSPTRSPETPPQLPEPQAEEMQEYRSDLVKEYDEFQHEALIHEQRERQALEETQPHEKYINVVSNRSPKGKLAMTLVGRPIDLFKLENYLIFNMSPRTNVTLMRYNEVKAWEDAGYGRKAIMRKRRGIGGLLIVIVLIIIMLVVGIVFIMYGPQIMQALGGMFGGVTGG